VSSKTTVNQSWGAGVRRGEGKCSARLQSPQALGHHRRRRIATVNRPTIPTFDSSRRDYGIVAGRLCVIKLHVFSRTEGQLTVEGCTIERRRRHETSRNSSETENVVKLIRRRVASLRHANLRNCIHLCTQPGLSRGEIRIEMSLPVGKFGLHLMIKGFWAHELHTDLPS